MISFIKGSALSHELENMITNADDYLWLISPYIKLSERIKDDLKRIKKRDKVSIVIIYGKNDSDKSKSLSNSDFEFLKEFPNIKIGYEKNLHAKYYASEDFSLICSMNLHEFSQNTNIEAGVRIDRKSKMESLTHLSNYDIEADSYNYFLDIIEASEIEFEKKPIYKKEMLGLKNTYTHSEIIKEKPIEPKKSEIGFQSFQAPSTQFQNAQMPTKGFCIRTGNEIPFDVNRPFCYDAFKSWNQFKNIDFKESYCHATGQPSYGKTSMRNPILNQTRF